MEDLKHSDNLMLQEMPMPADMNHHGTLFGGTMLGYLDKAGAMVTIKEIKSHILLASMKEVNFKTPVTPREKVSVYAKIEKVGRSSITVQAQAWIAPLNDWDNEKLACTAQIVYVAVDKNLKPTPVELKK